MHSARARRDLRATIIACLTAAAWVVSMLPLVAVAHQDVALKIQKVSNQIEASPDDYNLYIKRGNLQRDHGDWDLALQDFDQADVRGPDSLDIDLDYYRAQVWLESGDAPLARPALDRFIQARPEHYRGRVLSARCWAALGNIEAATAEYATALKLAQSTTPDIYIERANMFVATGDTRSALASIQEGVDRIGPIITLIRFALALEESRNDYQAALGWLNQLPPTVQAQARWLLKKGDYYAALEHDAAAQEQWLAAQQALQALPVSRREVPANVALGETLQQRLGPNTP
jgi:tetratricopeptide (TPR) repeat protein